MRTLVITGGSSGIGKATASLFAERGWRVFELSRREVQKDDIPCTKGEIIHVTCDVRSEESTRSAVAQVLTMTDHVDVVISNAGFGISGAVEFTDLSEAERQMDVNFMGAVRFTQAVLPQLRRQQSGRIIFTSSVAAPLPVPFQSFYSASKAAINALALALANEVRPFGVSVSVMMPGDVSTGFTDARAKSSAGEEVYRHARKAITNMERDERAGMAPRQMAELFYHIATCRSPRPQYVGGFLYRVLCLLDRLLPKRLVNWIEYRLYS
ncbi:MAG: SDR family NAD(P)-dependent oxidoreductase [Paludibacteraceae bacterium]|nr:SDR family NAD(P)-dependent oxidoreductase [Paludibacteraceae bacterium]